MQPRVQLRAVDRAEAAARRRTAASRTEPAGLVQQAWVIRALLDDPVLSATAAGRLAGFTREDAGPRWVRRFNAAGVDGLRDAPRAGPPPTHAPAVRDQLVALAVRKPRGLGEPLALWTLERLQRAFEQPTGPALRTARRSDVGAQRPAPGQGGAGGPWMLASRVAQNGNGPGGDPT